MKITYERGIDHCQPMLYVKEVTISTIEPAVNSDFLDKITFVEIGWNAISKRGLHKPGQRVMFIPPESVLPYELGEALEITKYLSKGRVRVTKLRGNRSEGLIVNSEKIEPYIPYIMKWEDLPSVQMQGEMISPSEISIDFCKFYQMPNILNEPNIFECGEKIIYSEKIHGTNTRCGCLINPVTEEYQIYIGSHDIVLKESEKNIYWRVVKEKLADRLPRDITMFGEIFGRGIQHLHYDKSLPDILLFAASRRGDYMPNSAFLRMCEQYNLPHVKFHTTRFESIEQMRELADGPSELTSSHMREGIVVTSAFYPERMAKCLGFNYLTSKKKTERH